MLSWMDSLRIYTGKVVCSKTIFSVTAFVCGRAQRYRPAYGQSRGSEARSRE